jgi:DNA-binding GntR family transcriptional regulator
VNQRRLESIQVRTLGEEAADKIRRAIASGHFPAGARLVETELAQELGLSRSPVREAFLLLEQEGLIVRHPRRGAFVRGLSRRETEEIYSIRTVLESFAVRRVVERMQAELATSLHVLLERLRDAAQAEDLEAFGQADAALHEQIIDAADHLLLKQMFSGLQTRMLQYMTEASRSRPLMGIVEDHEELLNAILSGDADQAAETMNRHVLASAARLLADLPYNIKESETVR